MNADMMDFGMGGPDLAGTTWWSRDGKDHFTVRDIMMGSEGFVIQTMDGRHLNADVMETYVQSDEPISIPTEAPQARVDTSNLDPTNGSVRVDDGPKFGNLRYSRPGVSFEEPRQSPTRRNPEPLPGREKPLMDNVDAAMIDRVLNGWNTDQIDISIMRNDKVDNAITTLTQVLNVSRGSIQEYLLDVVSVNLYTMFSDAINKYLDKVLGPEEKEEPDNGSHPEGKDDKGDVD